MDFSSATPRPKTLGTAGLRRTGAGGSLDNCGSPGYFGGVHRASRDAPGPSFAKRSPRQQPGPPKLESIHRPRIPSSKAGENSQENPRFSGKRALFGPIPADYRLMHITGS